MGGTKIELALCDANGRIHQEHRYETKVEGGAEAVKKQIIDGVGLLGRQAHEDIAGIGIGVAGQIDEKSGTVKSAPNLGWKNESLKQALADETDLPVTVINDVRAAAWAEWQHGAGRNCNDLVCVFIGTGIGGGIVSNGRMLTGAADTAGEIGHMTIDLEGAMCHCGNRGCLETLAGGWAIADRAAETAAARPSRAACILEKADGKAEDITAEMVIEAYHQSDELARMLVETAGRAVVAGISGLVNVVNPERVIMGGGIINGLPEMIKWVDEGVRFRSLVSAAENLAVTPARLGNKAGVIGAATVARQQFVS